MVITYSNLCITTFAVNISDINSTQVHSVLSVQTLKFIVAVPKLNRFTILLCLSVKFISEIHCGYFKMDLTLKL